MINNNKILTVSYGTFSCTLEGFDDSFDTMKAIAEYFRDLAADDRYFGAEPPQPDADMLARIAEREVSRRVEAHEHEGRIMLKAHDEAATATPVAAAAAATAAAVEEAPAVETAPVEEPVARAAKPEAAEEDVSAPVLEEPEQEETPELAVEVEQVEAHEADAETSEFETVAEVAESANVEASEEDTDVAVEINETMEDSIEVSAEPEAAEESVECAVDDVEEVVEAVADQEVVEAVADAELDVADASNVKEEDYLEGAAAFFADSTVVDGVDPETEEEISVESFTAFTSLTEETDEDVSGAEEEVVEDLVAEAVDAQESFKAPESFADKLQRIRAVVSQSDDNVDDANYEEESIETEVETDFASIASAFETDTSDAVEEELTAAAQDIADAFEQDDETQSQHQAFADEADDLDTILSRIEAGEQTDDAEAGLDLTAEDDLDEPTDNLFDASEEADADDVHGRVLKVNRAELEAALETGELEEFEDENLVLSPALSDEDEADLQRDLAALEDHDTSEDAPAAARESLPEIDADSSEDVSRLMAEADHQMAEPEGRTRRSAFAHLRAAVAARFADRSMDDDANKVEEEAEAYKSDLAEVVKPRRPIASETRTERPAEIQAAPLKLVAEQRIDAEVASSRGPVSPRRVAASEEEDIDLGEDSGFAAYAEERGASSLTELLEAAAAYLAYVEGHEQFSRPQLMTRVRQAECGDFSREDGLRSFGQLLRTGKIEKIKGGRFAASEAIGYKPDHRAAG